MRLFPEKLNAKLASRKENNTLRNLPSDTGLIDFSSNDYLGFARSESIFKKTHQLLLEKGIMQNGATGSRLLSGNHILYTETETLIARCYHATTALIFNSGYSANMSFFSSVPQRGDIVLYDEHIHASIRDGIRMSHAKSYKFQNNDLKGLEAKLAKFAGLNCEIYVVSESVFSMDGESPDLLELSRVCTKENVHLIVDEAHGVGVFGANGAGLLEELMLENTVFARIITFGKAMGCHGAAVLGSENLKNYLTNFARGFVYTTGLPPHSLATIQIACQEQIAHPETRIFLRKNITFFKKEIKKYKLDSFFVPSDSAIHCAIIPGNAKVKRIAFLFQNKGFDIKPIVSPTVPKGKERIRFCLHSYNSMAEISEVLSLLAIFVKEI